MSQLDYIRLDTDFFDKPKVKGLAYRFGQGAVSFLLRLLCSMGRATDGTISRDAWEAIGADATLDPNTAETIVLYCLENQILEGDISYLTNARVQEDQDALTKKRGSTRTRVKACRARQRELTVVAPPEITAVQSYSPLRRESREAVTSAPPAPHFEPLRAVPMTAKSEEFSTDDPNMVIALEKLEKPTGQPWTLDNRFVGAGRRPMKDYPTIWMTPPELADVIKKLEESQIPVQAYKDLFLKAEARLRTYDTQGRSSQNVSVYNWMTGFLFDELLERTIKETRLAKTIEGGQQRYEQRR